MLDRWSVYKFKDAAKGNYYIRPVEKAGKDEWLAESFPRKARDYERFFIREDEVVYCRDLADFD